MATRRCEGATSSTLDWASLPAREERTVFHVGDLRAGLDAPPPARSGSYEGPGVSVSRCPAAWTRIARLGGYATWMLCRRDQRAGRFLDVHGLSPAERASLTSTAVATGLLTPSASYVVSSYDDELETRVECAFGTLDQALHESDFVVADDGASDASEADITRSALARRTECALARLAGGTASVTILGRRQGDEPALVVRRDWVPSAALETWWHGTFARRISTGAAEEIAWMYLVETGSPLDGLWWTDRLDPIRLSAPRGVIVPRALPQWVAERASATALAALGERND